METRVRTLTLLNVAEEEMISKQEAALEQARAEFSKEKDALQAQHLEALGAFQAQLAQLTQDAVNLAELKQENEAMSREFGEQREHILQLIRDDEFKESLFDMLRDVRPLQKSIENYACFRFPIVFFGVHASLIYIVPYSP